jgi:hypothetical protein
MSFPLFAHHFLAPAGGKTMAWWSKQTFGTHVFLSLVVGFVIGISAEVLADTVYTWTTDDGTVAFTDEDKRIPARYRDSAQQRELQGLSGYERYTPVESAKQTAATPDVAAAPPSAAPVVVVTPAQSGISVMTGGTRYGQGGVILPIDAAPAGDEPLVIEHLRVKRDDSMATNHETVIRQGEKVISVRRDEPTHRDGTEMVPPLD